MRPERVLLLRSGRHLGLALSALQARLPGCEIGVVGTPGSEAAIAAAGVPGLCTFIYRGRPRFTPLAFACSSAGIAARCWGYDHVAVLWNDPEGTGQGNVDRTALLLAPRGFLAVTPDGRITERRVTPQIRREIRRAITSVAAAVVLGALYIPALILPGRRS